MLLHPIYSPIQRQVICTEAHANQVQQLLILIKWICYQTTSQKQRHICSLTKLKNPTAVQVNLFSVISTLKGISFVLTLFLSKDSGAGQ